MQQVIGGVLILTAIIHFAVKICVWRDCARGQGGGAPELDGVIFPPIFITVGISWIDRATEVLRLSAWTYIGIWIGLTALAYGTMVFVERHDSKASTQD